MRQTKPDTPANYVSHNSHLCTRESVDFQLHLSRIRSAVIRDGGATVGRAGFELLCPAHMTVPEQFQRIAEIADAEGWSFAFLPDGTVHFGLCARTTWPCR